MTTSYRTIAAKSEGIFKDRGSKFIALAFHVEDEEEIRAVLDQLRKDYHDARHHCYAWRLGTDPSRERANDDGEPTNSAGKPILNQIGKYRLTNVLVVVIRYFGGTLLGVGGLINAYRTATGEALKSARISRRKIQATYLLRFGYPQMNDVMTLVKEYKLEAYDQQFEINCEMKVRIDVEQEKKVTNRLGMINGCSLTPLENRDL